LALCAAFAAPGTAQAGLLWTDAADDCNPEIAQRFARWNDLAYYRLSPGGAFEGTTEWRLANGARTTNGNEPFYVNSSADTRSLLLPAGAVATSPTMCFAFGDWHARFFLRKAGAGSGKVEVDILVRNLLGILSVLDGGTVTADGTWDPSPRTSALVSNVGGLLGLSSSVALRFRAHGTAFQLDDVYLDPFRAR
jgi:hypothetical protein